MDNIQKELKCVCEFIQEFKGYYVYPKDFDNKQELEKLINIFYETYPYYKSNVIITILYYTNTELHKILYKLFFLSAYSYKTINTKLTSIQDNFTDNMYYIIQEIGLEYLPISFIQPYSDEIIYKDNVLSIIKHHLI